MERLIVQRYDVEVKSKKKLEELMDDINDWTVYLEPTDCFEYEPDKIMGKLDIETSPCFDDDIEDSKSILNNATEFLEWYWTKNVMCHKCHKIGEWKVWERNYICPDCIPTI